MADAGNNPLAGLEALTRMTSGMQQGNNQMSALLAELGGKDLLARRANTDTLGQIDAQGQNAFDTALATNKFLTNRSAPKVTSQTAATMERSRFGEDMARTAQAQSNLGEAGLFAGDFIDDGKGGVLLKPPSNAADLMKDYPLYSGESTKISAARAQGEAMRSQTDNTKIGDVIDTRTGKPKSPYATRERGSEQKEVDKSKVPSARGQLVRGIYNKKSDGTRRPAEFWVVPGQEPVLKRFLD